MDLLTLVDHLVNFCAPALWMAGAAVLCGGLVMPAKGAVWPKRLGCDFVVGVVVLVVGLLLLGSDGKMATWIALAVAVSLSECLLRRAWRR